MKIYLDDLRSAPDGYRIARNFNEFKQLLKEAHETGESVEAISFDNDLGQGEVEGWEIMEWVGENHPEYLVGETEIGIHTANPSAEKNMEQYLEWARKNKEEFLEAKQREHPWGEMKRK